MNKRQKEVLQSALEDEKAVFKLLEKNYTAALADVKRNIRELQANPLTQSKAYQLEFQKQLAMQEFHFYCRISEQFIQKFFSWEYV